MNHSFCESLLTGVILPLFKGKGTKASNKDNYRGITLFPNLCKIYEMVLLSRLEKHAVDEGLFSDMQFAFKEGAGCTEASFTILETINHMLERGSQVFGYFLDVRKAFDTVWIDGLLYKLFSEFGVKGRMWLATKTLYTGVKAQVLYSCSLSRKFVVSQGTGQGRILAPFMYKVYINSLLVELTQHSFAISINMLSLPSPSFADDITLLATHPTFLGTFMNLCYGYSIRWRYQFHNDKSGIVTFGEAKRTHCQSIKQRNWVLGNETVDKRYEYKNLGVVKNYAGSFSSNVEDNIDKTRKKAGMIFASGFDRQKVHPFVYIKFWRQACLPSLLYGVELFTVTPTLIEKLERRQLWFLKNLFFVPKFTPRHLLLKLSELNSVESEIALRKFLFLGRLITDTKMVPVVRKFFYTRAKSFFDTSIDSLGVLPSICDALKKYGLFCYFFCYFGSLILLFPPTSHGKLWCIAKFKNLKLTRGIRLLLTILIYTFVADHPDLHVCC